MKFTGNKDVDQKILISLSDGELLNSCQINSYVRNKVCDGDFLKRRLRETYPDTLNYKPEDKDKSWRQYFLETIYYIAKLKEIYGYSYKEKDPKRQYELFTKSQKGQSKYIFANEAHRKENILRQIIYNATKEKYMDLLKFLIEKNPEIKGTVLNFAANQGYIDMVQYIINTGISVIYLNDAMYLASEKGNIDIVKLALENGANIRDTAMVRAAGLGHINIVRYLIENGAGGFERAMISAASGGHIDIVKLMIENGATDFDSAMIGAAADGHIDIVRLMIENGATDFDEAMLVATDIGYVDIVKLMLNNGATNLNDTMMHAISEGHREGHLDIVKLMVENGADDLENAREIAINKEYKDISDYLTKKIAEK